jgi:hypothetical protein
MNRIEFMKQLERLLWDIPEQECRDAIDFYNAYFDDAGPENEAQVIRELGSPGKVAAIIKADLKGASGSETYGEYTEAGYQDDRFTGGSQVPDRTNVVRNREGAGQERRGYQGRHPRTGGNLALVIIILILTSPVWIGLAGGILGVLGGLVFGLLGLILGVAAGALGLMVGGGAAVVTGIIRIAAHPAAGLAVSGAGFLMLAIGLLLFVAFLWGMVKLLPMVLRGVVGLCQRLFHRGRGGDRT